MFLFYNFTSINKGPIQLLMSINKFCFLLLSASFLFIQTGLSQTTTVEGYVKEKGTDNPVPFVHILFKGTQTGTATDTAGYFITTINTANIKEDSIIISSLGYTAQKISFKIYRSIIMCRMFTYFTSTMYSYDIKNRIGRPCIFFNTIFVIQCTFKFRTPTI